ncbi:DNA-directed RNA polymerase II subunit RPB4 [Erinaceus europaeus]|uniref:DNA-directed RNA polymerase II subunit RPB4 n=1 Tax=Erinaceus europaeus TaxID=9365 RepID=A0A1S2ZRT8_ERIEU|nr:DNA-directed RNA polymerase II subunit RPB4 [Erinaceus europaeus]
MYSNHLYHQYFQDFKSVGEIEIKMCCSSQRCINSKTRKTEPCGEELRETIVEIKQSRDQGQLGGGLHICVEFEVCIPLLSLNHAAKALVYAAESGPGKEDFGRLFTVELSSFLAAGCSDLWAIDAEEDASQLIFPKEFETTETLLNSEVHLLLEHRKQQNESAEDEQELSKVFIKTLNSTAHFSPFKNRDTIASVCSLLLQKKLHKVELARLANLWPEAAEESKARIPSLEGRFEDEELWQILNNIQTKCSSQY